MGNKKYRYTVENEKWILENLKNSYTTKEVYNNFCKEFNIYVSYQSFKIKCVRLNCKNKRYYTQEQDNFIIDLIKQKKCFIEIVELLNQKFNDNKTKESIMKRYEKHLKGKVKYTTENLKETHFKKQSPIGTIITLGKGKKKSIILIKTKMIPAQEIGNITPYDCRYWRPYSEYIYEKYYNCKLKENEIIIHLDGNYENNNIGNLVCGTLGSLGYAYGKIRQNEQENKDIDFNKSRCKKLAIILGCLNYKINQ